MSAVTRPRGPLPRRVYWARRVGVVALLLGLVYGVAHLLQGSWGPGDGATATTVAAETSSSPAAAAPTGTPSAGTSVGPTTSRHEGGASSAPADPVGTCADSDVVVTPRITGAHVGQPIEIDLELTTQESPACTWEVSADSVYLKVTQGSGPEALRVWSSQQCPAAVSSQAVVPRQTRPDHVTVLWNGQRSDDTCSSSPPWAMPGRYVAVAAARGSTDPVDTPFRLARAVRRTVMAAPTPGRADQESPDESRQTSPQESPTDRPTR